MPVLQASIAGKLLTRLRPDLPLKSLGQRPTCAVRRATCAAADSPACPERLVAKPESVPTNCLSNA